MFVYVYNTYIHTRNIQEMWDTIKKKFQIIVIDEEKTPKSITYTRFLTRSQNTSQT